MKKQDKTEILKVIPLGGQGEIGKNCWIFEYKEEIIIVNFGMMLPPHNLTGVDLVLPGTNYLIENQEKIKGLVITSAHDDSCGGIFYLLNKLKIPKIWGSRLAVEFIKTQLKETSLPEVEFLQSRKEFQIGNEFIIKPICNTSTLPDTFGLLIKSFCPNIFGQELVKAGLILSIVGGSFLDDSLEEQHSFRKNIHSLLIGNK